VNTQSRKNTTKKSKKVSFGNTEVQLYDIIAGDNPAVEKGPPITIDWKPFYRIGWTVDAYEAAHPRGVVDYKLSYNERYELLIRQGYTNEYIRYCDQQASSIRKLRRETIGKLPYESLHAARELMAKAVRNATKTKEQRTKEKQWNALCAEMAAISLAQTTSTTRLVPSGPRRID
jgi:hypothetical protein